MNNKGVIYYTDNRIKEPIRTRVRETILQSHLPITSVSLGVTDFGTINLVLNDKPGYVTMVKQIVMALEYTPTKYVFFCEHDVLYHPSHFDFIPPRDDIYYYNENNWRWLYGSPTAIRYDRMISLSGLCVNTELVLNNFKMRLDRILEAGLDKFTSREPDLARKWGYEPGTKKMKRGGITDDNFEMWRSERPNIDIRHEGTFSPPKVTLENFKHPPVNWKEIPIRDIPDWHLKSLFNL